MFSVVGKPMVPENSLLSYRVKVPTNSVHFPLSFWLQFTDLSDLFSFILKAIKRCFNAAKQIKRCFPNQNRFSKSKPQEKKKLRTQILENRERLSDKKIYIYIYIYRRIEKTKIFMENPKARNKKESKPKSNLNLSNKKTQ